MMRYNISDMMNPEIYPHPTEDIELIETHISWVILTGHFAYKIKKPVDFGFLDFSTLDKRLKYCNQELRLNRRIAHSIYLEVVTITEVSGNLRIAGDGEIIEYAVKMLQFPQSAQLDNMLSDGHLNTDHMDDFAHMIANFHTSIPIADQFSSYGNSASVYKPVEENFRQIEQHMDTGAYSDSLSTVRQWNENEYTKLQQTLNERKADGYIRECHGDMHLRNMVLIDGQPMAFDCIEFNPQLRWIDVMSEVAFLMMDLQDRQHPELANRFINSYLEITGDYHGLSLLPFYLCYRAMVRAKVCSLRLEQSNLPEKDKNETLDEFESYIKLALSYTEKRQPTLTLMRGLSASGKSTVSQQLIDATGAIRIRSDVERKRLFDITSTSDRHTDIDSGIYSQAASQQTYSRLAELAEVILETGVSVIVDAAFLKKQRRDPFRSLADRLNTPYFIMEVTAPADILKRRIEERKNDISDADIEVLEHQLKNNEPLDGSEITSAVTVDTTETLNIDLLANIIINR